MGPVSEEPLVWRAGPRAIDCSAGTVVMGILNVTPDSFYDAGRHYNPSDPSAAIGRAHQLTSEGAEITVRKGRS